MIRLRLALFWLGLCVLAPLAWGQWTEKVHEAPAAELVMLTSPQPANWRPNKFPADFKLQVTNGGRRAYLSSGLPGSERVVVAMPLNAPPPAEDGEVNDEGSVAVVHIIRAKGRPGPGPGPQPDPDPEPGPGPDPGPQPEPDPQPDPPPIPNVTGLHVMIVYDEVEQLPTSQQRILYGPEFETWLNANLPKGPDGEPTRRMYPDATDVSGDEEKWKTAFNLAPKDDLSKLPWLILSNGKTGYSGPLPLTIEETIKLAEKYVPK